MKNTNTNALELDYKTDIRKILNTCIDSTTFIGNIDPSGILAMGTLEDVERVTTELLNIYKNSPRLILNAGCAIPAETPAENIRKMIEIAHTV
jgi:uroporphyrinogen decarboxylase